MGYNENEIWTGKYWIDGKKIYKKAGFSSGSTGTAEKVLDATLTLSYVDKLICGFSNGLNAAENRIFLGGCFASSDVGRLSLNVTSSGLVYMASAEARKDIAWWVEYTKN